MADWQNPDPLKCGCLGTGWFDESDPGAESSRWTRCVYHAHRKGCPDFKPDGEGCCVNCGCDRELHSIKLFVDDTRAVPEGWGSWLIVRTFNEAKMILESEQDITAVSLDHDLGSEDEAQNGYELAKIIERRAYTERMYEPPIVLVHSDNGPGRKNIELCIKSIDRARGIDT